MSRIASPPSFSSLLHDTTHLIYIIHHPSLRRQQPRHQRVPARLHEIVELSLAIGLRYGNVGLLLEGGFEDLVEHIAIEFLVGVGGDILAVGDELDEIVLGEVIFELFIHILEDLLLIESIFFGLVEDEGVEEVYQLDRTASAVLVLESTQQLPRLLQTQSSLLLLLHHIIFNISSSVIPQLGYDEGRRMLRGS